MTARERFGKESDEKELAHHVGENNPFSPIPSSRYIIYTIHFLKSVVHVDKYDYNYNVKANTTTTKTRHFCGRRAEHASILFSKSNSSP